jgi:transketolase
MASQTEQWSELAAQLRVDSIRAAHAAGSGHPTSSLSAADLMAVLMSEYLHYNYDDPDNPANDHLIFSKGHASPLIYAMFKAAGAISDDDLLSFRKFGSPYQGHPTPIIPWVDVATGSLGQGLPIGVGIALAGKYLDKLPYTTWVVCGDSEMAEGSMWEAFDKAGHYNLGNLVAILDMNRLGQRGETDLGWDTEAYAARAASFGWHVIGIDGHNVDEIDRAYREAIEPREQPTFIIAKTMKGRGVSFLEDKLNWHGKPTDDESTKKALEELGGERHITVEVHHPEAGTPASTGQTGTLQLPRYEKGAKEATRAAYGDALKAVGAARPDVVALDAEVSNSTYAERFAKEFPDRFFEMFIAEQQMVAAAVGLGVRGYAPFASTFAAFLSRAYDFIRMGAISQANIKLCGSHAGVSIGEDGPSQMALEDLAMMRAVHGSVVLYPSDPNQTAHLVAAMADHTGISFLRTTREKTAVLYDADDTFAIGGSKVLRQSDDDKVTIVAAGITVHEAIKASETLAGEGINVRLIDAYSVKPLDVATIQEALSATDGRLIVAEDHWPEGGLGGAVLEALAGSGNGQSPLPTAFVHLAVQGMPTSGSPQELLHAAGIDAAHIADAVRGLAK